MPPSTNGIMRIGLKMMGAPKIAGSEIRKKLGTIDALPNALSCCDFALNAQSSHKRERITPGAADEVDGQRHEHRVELKRLPGSIERGVGGKGRQARPGR